MNSSALFCLKNKTAVIIGGTGELGGAIAETLAAHGANIVLAGRNAEKAAARIAKIESANGTASFENCDAGDKNSLENLLQNVLKKHGRVDILLNGAGANSGTPFFEISGEEFDRLFQINVKSVFLACQVFGKYFLETKTPASIINIGSESGMTPLSRVFTYSATKAAVHNLSKNLAREWAPHGIRVNTLVPGFFPAEQNRKILSPDRVATILGKTPMGRFGEACELGGVCVLLASAAGSFITGAEFVVDGGFNAMSI